MAGYSGSVEASGALVKAFSVLTGKLNATVPKSMSRGLKAKLSVESKGNSARWLNRLNKLGFSATQGTGFGFLSKLLFHI